MKFKVKIIRTVRQSLNAEVEVVLSPEEQIDYTTGKLTDEDLECWAQDQAYDEGTWKEFDSDTTSCQITKIE